MWRDGMENRRYRTAQRRQLQCLGCMQLGAATASVVIAPSLYVGGSKNLNMLRQTYDQRAG
jgi:hypothetical protein